MSEKREFSEYEKRILASAYNLRDYCKKFKHCEDCIFNKPYLRCVLVDYTTPYGWELKEVGVK